MTKHTQGPWLDIGLESPWGYVIKHNGGSSISYIAAYDLKEGEPEPYGKWDANSIANRSLVLAAPELLEALKRCQKQLQGLSFKDQDIVLAIERAYTAILKAEGANT